MIPRYRQPAPPPESTVPQDLPPIEHQATDWTFLLTNGHVVTFTVTDGDGVVVEEADRYILERTDSRIELAKPVAMVETLARTFETDPPLYVPRNS